MIARNQAVTDLRTGDSPQNWATNLANKTEQGLLQQEPGPELLFHLLATSQVPRWALELCSSDL